MMTVLKWILIFPLLAFCIQETSTCKPRSTDQDLVTVRSSGWFIKQAQLKTMLQSFITFISVEQPLIGKSVNILITCFWPDDKPDVFETIKTQIEDLVDKKIFQFEEKNLQGEINGIQYDLSSYSKSLTHEKGSYLTAILTQCNSLFSRMRISDNRHHLVPLMVTVGLVHLNMLRERSLFGKELFEEDNQNAWDMELKFWVENYQKELKPMYLEWIKWRKAKIVTFSRPSKTPRMPLGDTATGMVTDTLTSMEIGWSDWGNLYDVFAPEVLIQKQSWFSVANAEYFSIYSKSFHFPKFIPNQEQKLPTIPAGFEILDVGPFYWDDPDGNNNRPKSPQHWDEPGKNAGILIREYNSIDGLQFKYIDHDGYFVGNPSGGNEHIHTFSKEKRLAAIGMGFNNRGLVELTITDTDGHCEMMTTTYGNRGNWIVRRTTFHIPESEGYIINSVAMSKGFSGFIDAVHFKFRASEKSIWYPTHGIKPLCSITCDCD